MRDPERYRSGRNGGASKALCPVKSRARGFESHPLRARRPNAARSIRVLAAAALAAVAGTAAAAPPARPAPATGASLTVATWNIAWFGDGDDDDVLTGNIRGGRHLRDAADLDRLRAVVARLVALGVEAVGLQEIENFAAARRLFPEPEWALFVSRRNPAPEWAQRTAIAVRRASGWQVERHPDVLEWSPLGRDRYGVDLTLTRGGERVRLLTVHFQSGCHGAALTSDRRQCGFLRMQFAVLKGWLHERFLERTPVVVAGDWNRFLSRGEEGDAALFPGKPLVLPEPGSSPGCWDGHFDHFVDHIVAFDAGGGRPASRRFEEVRYGAPFSRRDRYSDHCPLVAELTFAAE